MNIAFYTPTLEMGGYEKVVVNYANAFVKHHNISILCGFAKGALKESVNENVHIVDFNCRSRGVLKALVHFLTKNRVDILYVPFASFISIAVVAKKIAKSQVIIYGSQHGFERKSIFDHLLGRLVKKADVLTAVSNAVADYDSSRLRIDRSRYNIFDNPVISGYEIKKEGHRWFEDRKSPVLVLSGRLTKDKRCDLAIKIFSEVLKYTDLNLLILGTGPQMDALKHQCESLGIKDKVEFLGFVSNPLGYLCQCDIFMHTAVIESFGNVVVEALYCGLPVITTDCGGPIDIIENGKYGINIGPHDAEDVVQRGVEAVLKIINGEVRFEGMKEKALKYDASKLEEQFLRPYYVFKQGGRI